MHASSMSHFYSSMPDANTLPVHLLYYLSDQETRQNGGRGNAEITRHAVDPYGHARLARMAQQHEHQESQYRVDVQHVPGPEHTPLHQPKLQPTAGYGVR